MEPLEALDSARAELRSRLVLVEPGQWSLPTPCTEWDVRELCNHVVGGGLRYWMLLEGVSAEEVAATRDVDHLGDRPEESFDRFEAALDAALRSDGALDRTVHHRYGDTTGLGLVAYRTVDCAIHGWDLARAIGADETLDPALLADLNLILSGSAFGASPGFTVPMTPPSTGMELQARVLYLAGRSV